MSIKFKSNNIIALIIAVVLIATGIGLGVINSQSQTTGHDQLQSFGPGR